jgi:hypothetical protein
MLHEDDKIMKTNIYVQQTWASPKFSQAKTKNMKEHPKNLHVTLSLTEGMTCMNVLNNEGTSLLYTLLIVVAYHNIIHLELSFASRNTLGWTIQLTKFTSLYIFSKPRRALKVGSRTFSQS